MIYRLRRKDGLNGGERAKWEAHKDRKDQVKTPPSRTSCFSKSKGSMPPLTANLGASVASEWSNFKEEMARSMTVLESIRRERDDYLQGPTSGSERASGYELHIPVTPRSM